MKKKCESCFPPGDRTRYLLRRMKLTVILSLLVVMSFGNTFSQGTKLSIQLKNSSIRNVIDVLEKETNYVFLYKDDIFDFSSRVDLVIDDSDFEIVLKRFCEIMDVDYEIRDRQVILKERVSTDKIEINVNEDNNKHITGFVYDSDGKPIPGVTVVAKGTTMGTISDLDGAYAIDLEEDQTVLKFSFVGMRTQEIAVGKQTSIDVVMEEETIGLEEVVAVGYGTMKKRDIIGAISTVEAKSLEIKSSASFDAGLQGLASGVLVQSESGIPGAPTTISIRGKNSIKSGTDPLWIVDGMPIYSNPGGMNSSFGSSNQSPMSMINASDIESVQVLKDAAATAIYGSRASNGVIIITTKSGKKNGGETRVSLSSGVGSVSKTPADLGYVNTPQWFAALDESYANSGKQFIMNDYYRFSPFAFTVIDRQTAESINTDWYDEVFRKGSFRDFNLSSSKGFEDGSLYLSLNYRKDEGVMKHNSLERFSGRSNIDFKPTKNLSLGARLSFSYTNNNRLQSSDFRDGQRGSIGGMNAVTTQALPWMPVYDLENPERYFNAYSASNPVASSDPENYYNGVLQYRGLGGFYADYNVPFVKGLSIRSEASFDLLQSNGVFWQNRDITLDSESNPTTKATERAITYQSMNTNAYATYSRTLEEHSINVVFGTEAQRIKQYARTMQGEDLVGQYQELGTPGEMISMSAKINTERYLLAYFSRANYKYKDKYLLGISFRRDGSSAFTEDYRWGFFPAFSAGWVLSDEDFMSFVSDKTFLKLRASYGETGNQSVVSGLDVINFNGSLVYGGGTIGGLNGTAPRNIAVSELTWESTNSFDVGLDFGFHDNRINGSLTYYNKKVSGMLLQGPVAVSSGVTSSQAFAGNYYDENANIVWGNVGDMSNAGVELELTSVNINSPSFKWTTTLNFTYNQNEILKLTKEADQTGKGLVTLRTVSRTGGSREEWFVAKWAGVDPDNGVPMVYVRDDEVYNETGETVIAQTVSGSDSLTYATQTNIESNQFYHPGKSADPKYYGGITNTFEYKGFDFSFLFTFSGGNYIYDYDYQMSNKVRETFTFRQEAVDKAWRNPGDITRYPKLTFDGTYTIDGTSLSGFNDAYVYYDKYLFKGDFIRLKNIQLGYTFDKKITQKMKLQGLRLYVSGTNLWTGTKYPGFEVEGAGFVNTAKVPQLRSFIAGIDIKF